jgi:site-specific DNA-methyltransferase (adenine-specific)
VTLGGAPRPPARVRYAAAMPECVLGDARDDESYVRALGGELADVVITDPPYCLLTRRRKGGDFREPHAGRKIDRQPVTRFETVRDYRAFTEQWLPRAVSHLRPNGAMAVWTNFLGKEPITIVARSLRYEPVDEFVWAKRTSEREGNEQLLRVYETALLFSREPLAPLQDADPPRCHCVAAGYDDDGEAARWGSHPNHKPFSVLEALLRSWSRPGQLVLDPFAGSGSIPAAALRLGRRAACIEIDAEWAGRVRDRLARAR